jgi:hypothetical protein
MHVSLMSGFSRARARVYPVSSLIAFIVSASFFLTPLPSWSQDSRPDADADVAEALVRLKACVDHEVQHTRSPRKIDQTAQALFKLCQRDYRRYLGACTLPGLELKTCKEVIETWTADRIEEIKR